MTRATDALDSLVARTPEDVVAAVPIVLGFVPDESVVMLTHGAEHPFHARVDLPTGGRHRRECSEALLAPALRHRVSAVVFVLYTADVALARGCAKTLLRTFARSGVEVIAVLRVDGGRWFSFSPGRRDEGPGQACDVSGHAFTARAVASGRVMLSSRAELAATVAADGPASDAVAAAAHGWDALDPADEPAWALSTVGRLVAEVAQPDPATTARLLLGLRLPEVRDAVLGSLDRSSADLVLPLLSALVRAAPPDLVAPVASTLAFAAWLAGDGALAWCAVERADTGTEPCSLAGHVARALELAMPPAVWGRQ
jgi:hypothetical protein